MNGTTSGPKRDRPGTCAHRNWHAWSHNKYAECRDCGATFPKPERPPEPPKLRRVK